MAETAHLYARASYCLLQMRETVRGLLLLEQGNTRLLSEALALAEVDLAMLPEARRQAVVGARQAVRQLEGETRLAAAPTRN